MIYIQTKSKEDWKQFLAEPDKQWKDGYSAKSLATCWQGANGIPKKVKQVFANTHCIELKDVEMLFGIPEYKVVLPRGRASQNDLFVLARTNKEIFPIMVEGKVNESFGPLVGEWIIKMSDGKKERLEYLCKLLNLTNRNIDNIRYQLLHRTASAIITANKYHCNTAMLLIHSFSPLNKSFKDYSDFINLYNLEAQLDGIIGPVILNGVRVYWGWVKDEV
ncbi:hypothetical protein LL037_21190 [Clostridium estertheticum]|uniref:DUF6946 family protein n=1 Tax=Clostridium estertheticum TaxID=238834 RepID=UPI001C0DBFF6|nr:hypothetical protein [Clostridium estertheticum]MBU3198260.1 hypothetical protein [Clostridium estertheticum]MCB2354397.1 hypothetical protein [Clostridium estertheticum]WAG42486.1 hypothetical protein LL065_07370 [Clostridium estertheticum]WAG64951.1 hypothetical protein LL037_21190 [Clostridium estertheticum]